MSFAKRLVSILSVILSALLSSIIMVFIHEGGHALCCILCGGRVAGFSFVPQLTYAAYTEIDFTQAELTFEKHLFISTGGYLFVFLAAIVLFVIGIKFRSVFSFDCFIVSTIFSITSVASFVYAIVGICQYMLNGMEADSDIVCTIALYPTRWITCYISTIILLLLSIVLLALIIYHIKNRLSLFVNLIYK